MNIEERKALVTSYLGKSVHLIIDRPIGYEHKKEDFILTYPVNYGYIPGILGGDGEELDVYLLGVNEPIKECTAKIIGVVYRKNDTEDKLVAAPEGMRFHQGEIARQVYFQERYFETHIDAVYEKCCGAVVYRRINNKTEYLCLLQKKSGTYSVPKGHMEAFETEQQAALREIYEETGINAQLKNNFRMETQYTVTSSKQKSLVLFLAECDSEVNIDTDEISAYQWLDYEAAKQVLPSWYENILTQAEAYLRKEIC